MKNKIIQFIPAAIALVAIGFRYFSNWCILTNGFCYGTVVSHISLTITKPLYLFSLYFLPIALILIFVPRYLFNSWLKFAVWALPLLFIFIATTPVVDNALISFSRSDAARLAGQLFSAVSLLLILYKYLKLRQKRVV